MAWTTSTPSRVRQHPSAHAVGGAESGFAGFGNVGPGAVVNSTDGGATWTVQSLPTDTGALERDLVCLDDRL